MLPPQAPRLALRHPSLLAQAIETAGKLLGWDVQAVPAHVLGRAREALGAVRQAAARDELGAVDRHFARIVLALRLRSSDG